MFIKSVFILDCYTFPFYVTEFQCYRVLFLKIDKKIIYFNFIAK